MITKLINQDLIKLDLQASSKQEVFEELIEVLHQQGRIASK
ncbi:PTS system fructose-specific IIABC component, partial [Vibrio sinaloensis DSM 21326]